MATTPTPAPKPIVRRRLLWVPSGAGALIGLAAGLVMKDLDLPELVSYGGAREPLVIAAAVLGAALWRTRFRNLVEAGGLALALLWCAVAFTPLCSWLAQGLARDERPEQADAIFVLSSGLRADGSGGMARVLHGVELLASGMAPRLILTEATPPQQSYVADAKSMMGRLGLKQEVEVVNGVVNTRDESVKLGALFKERGWKMALVVTSPAHSRRAAAALEHVGVGVVSTPSRDSRFDMQALDSWGDRLDAFGTLMHERLGIWVYMRRGWLGTSVF